jgi:aspartate racemase
MATTARKIGLIGGLALRAGVFYYEQILRRYAAQERRLELVLAHADVSTVLACVAANDSPALGRYLGTIANELFDAGAELVAVTAIAPHLAIEEIMRVARGPMVNVLDVIPAGMATVGLRRVAVFGNRTVMETRIFGTLAKDATVVLDQSLVDEVHATYTDIALHGKGAHSPKSNSSRRQHVRHLRRVQRPSCWPEQICHPSMPRRRRPIRSWTSLGSISIGL